MHTLLVAMINVKRQQLSVALYLCHDCTAQIGIRDCDLHLASEGLKLVIHSSPVLHWMQINKSPSGLHGVTIYLGIVMRFRLCPL